MVIKRAFKELYPEKEFRFNPKLRYSAKFNGYNGNISLRGNNLTVSLARNWHDVDDDIKIGLIQILMNKIFKTNVKTLNMDLYNIFLQKVHLSVPKSDIDEELLLSFDRVNEKYLNGNVEMPNLVWGTRSMTKLGSYEYGDDKIVMSTILREAPEELLDLVMYHEVLHKKHKFKTHGKRSSYHTTDFRRDERRFDDYEGAEKRLTAFLRKKRWRRALFFD
jgi:hypothetical protein